jgi:hypothetical protein
MAGILDYFDPSTYGSPAPSGVLPPWLTQTIQGLQSGPSMLQAFPPARLPMAPGSYPTGSPVAGTAPMAQVDNPVPVSVPLPHSMTSPSGGLLPSLGTPAAGATASPGLGDRLSAGLLGFAHSGGALPAIANLISGLATGQRSDPQGMMLAQQAATLRALRSAGLSNPEAIAAMHPALARVLLAQAYRRSP